MSKSHHPFVWASTGPSPALLRHPFHRLAVRFINARILASVVLWWPDGTAVEIQSDMVDITDTLEIGVLHFSAVRKLNAGHSEQFFDVSPRFTEKFTASRLLIKESGITAESGIAFESNNGKRVIVVAGSIPFTLAVLGISDTLKQFQPEYELGGYAQKPLG
jgi:hypothetical protein